MVSQKFTENGNVCELSAFSDNFRCKLFLFQAAGGGGETLFNTLFHGWLMNFSGIFCNFAP
jgi:hypothetical protein